MVVAADTLIYLWALLEHAPAGTPSPTPPVDGGPDNPPPAGLLLFVLLIGLMAVVGRWAGGRDR
jgi:hypothetical protein